MIAAFLQLDHSLAVIALLPTRLLRHLRKRLRRFVRRTLARAVPLQVARRADMSPAVLAGSLISARPGILEDPMRLDPPPTLLLRAVQTVLGPELLVLFVPEHLEIVVEEVLHMAEGYRFGGATARRHQLRISGGELEDVLEAVVAHVVSAW